MKEQPRRPDIEIQATPYQDANVIGRHPDGSTTIYLRGELKIRVNPAQEAPTTPQEEWAFPTIEQRSPAHTALDKARQALSLWEDGDGRDIDTCDAMIEFREALDAIDKPSERIIPELETEPQTPEPVRFNILKLDDGRYKCFVPEENANGEDASFYLNLDEKTGEGKIEMSDPRDSHTLIDKFAKAFTDDL